MSAEPRTGSPRAAAVPPDVFAVDGLVYAGPSRFGDGRELDALTRDAAGLGIAGLVAAPARPPDQDLGGASARLADACAGGRSKSLARIDPWDADAATTLARLLERDAVAGLLLHPWEETFPVNHRRAVALARLTADAGKAIVVEAGFPLLSEALAVAELARAVAPSPVVATRGLQLNMSGLGQRSADLALSSAPNLHLGFAGMYRQDWLEGTIATVGPDRVLFGSLAPVFDQELELQRVLDAPLGDEERRRLLGGNAARLFGVDANPPGSRS